MADTFSQIYIHLVFAVKFRRALILPSWKVQLYQHICGHARNKGQKILEINGMTDHIHILIGMTTDCRLSDLVKEIKISSHNYINQRHLTLSKFYWQEGFGAFSYHRSMIPTVAKYIENQEKHHEKRGFVEEYVNLLERSQMDLGKKIPFIDPI